MIYVNGDSHSFGIGLDPQDRYSSLVAAHFGHECENQARSAASNDRILRTSRLFLQDHRPNLVIIGWTTWEREEWEYQGNYYNVNSSGYDALPVELENRYKHWVINQNEDSLQIKSDHWHQTIWQFHTELKQQNIPHLFFNCMYNFFNAKIQDWENNYIDPYDNDLSYYWYLKKQGYTTDAWYHYGKEGHACWAKFLIDHIEKNQLL